MDENMDIYLRLFEKIWVVFRLLWFYGILIEVDKERIRFLEGVLVGYRGLKKG